jgi:hypothetical protein
MQLTPRSWPSREKWGTAAPRPHTLMDRSSDADAKVLVSLRLNFTIIT